MVSGLFSRLKPRRDLFWWLTAGAIAGVVAVHYTGLMSSPPGFYVDEASVAVNAHGIMRYGVDEHGVHWPLFFEAFGDWKNPVNIYLLALVMRIVGYSTWLVRAVPSTLALLAAVLMAMLIDRLFNRRWLTLLTFVVVGVLPWLMVTGRIGFDGPEAASLSAFVLLWWYADRHPTFWRGLAAGVALLIVLYDYTPARLFVGLMYGGLVIAYLPELKRVSRALAGALVPVALGYIVMLRWSIEHPGALTARFGQVSILGHHLSPLGTIGLFWQVYSSNLSPDFFFFHGDAYGRHNTGHGGVLFVMLAVPLVVGLWALWRHRRSSYWRMVAIGLVLAGIPAALTDQFAHSLRDIYALPFLLLICAAGAAELGTLLKPQPAVMAILAGALVLEAGSFLIDYYTSYPQRVIFWYDSGLEQAMRLGMSTPHHGAVVLSDHLDQPELQFASFFGEDPALYRTEGIAPLGAALGHVDDATFPDGTVVVARADEAVKGGKVAHQVLIPAYDDFGRQTPDLEYRVWVVGADTQASADIDLAQFKPATASSSQNGHGPDAAFDQNDTTSWISAGPVPGQWLAVDLESPASVRRVRISQVPERDPHFVADVRISASDDGEHWTAITNLLLRGDVEDSALPAARAYRHWRLETIYGSETDGTMIRGFELFGIQLPAPAS